jgi:hypothetical protein
VAKMTAKALELLKLAERGYVEDFGFIRDAADSMFCQVR